ncbi:restriction endonuclease subunit S, partial [Lacticaseibacillus paracasei]
MVVDVFEVLLARNAWEKRKLGETNSYFTDGNYGESYPKESELSDKENGVPFLRGSNLRNGELIEDNANYITKEKHAELTSGHLVEDDIVLAVR